MNKERLITFFVLTLLFTLIIVNSISPIFSSKLSAESHKREINILHSSTSEYYCGSNVISDSLQLLINDPKIIYNYTHLTISNLTISFNNGTDISQADAYDNVSLKIYNRVGFVKYSLMIFDNETYQGWGITTSVPGSIPRTFFVDLVALTEKYYYNETIYSFKGYFEIFFYDHHLIPFFQEQSMVVHCSVTVQPPDYNYLDYILLEQGVLYAYILNETGYIVRNVSMYWGGFSGFYYMFSSGKFNASDLSQGYYYSKTILVYDEELYVSSSSNNVFYGEKEPSETSEPTSPETTKSDFFVIWGFFSTVVISMRYLLRMRRKTKFV